MIIPDPVANYGDAVWVTNYRKKPAIEERGLVKGLAYRADFGPSFSWTYTVILDRTVGHKPIRLYCSDSGLRKV